MRITVKNCPHACVSGLRQSPIRPVRNRFCEHRELRLGPGGCSQTRKPASDKEKRCFTPFAAGVRYEKIRFIGDGVRKSLRGSKHIKEFGDRCHKENTSIKRIETLLHRPPPLAHPHVTMRILNKGDLNVCLPLHPIDMAKGATMRTSQQKIETPATHSGSPATTSKREHLNKSSSLRNAG